MGRVRLRLRTKFLIAMLLTSAGLTAVSLLIVQRTVENQVRRDLSNDLANSVETFRNAQKEREAVLARSAKLMADLPSLKALMTSRHPPTIQDASDEMFRLSGGDLFALLDPQPVCGISHQSARHYSRASPTTAGTSQLAGPAMSRGRILEVVLTILGAVLLLIASAGKHPYGFYMVLRLVITVGAVYWAWRVYKAGQQVWTWIFVAVALLLNPFLPIRMQRTQWQPIDLYLGIFLIGWSGYWLFRKRTREFGIKRPAEEKAKEINEVHQILSDSQKRRLYRIAWTAVCLLVGGRFSTVVSSSDSGLGSIVTSTMTSVLAFGSFALAAWLWSRAISKVLSKIGITNFTMQAIVTGCLIVCAIHALNFASLAARSSTPETQLRTSVSGTNAPPVLNQNNASDANKGAVTNGISGASVGCHPPVFSQQEFSALEQKAANGDAAAQCGLGLEHFQCYRRPYPQ